MSPTETLRVNAIIDELTAQRLMLGDRAVNFAADKAELQSAKAELEKRVAELELKLQQKTDYSETR